VNIYEYTIASPVSLSVFAPSLSFQRAKFVSEPSLSNSSVDSPGLPKSAKVVVNCLRAAGLPKMDT